MIDEYNNLIVNHLDYDSNDKELNALDEYQNELAFYVDNPEWRKEDVSYYGPEILKEKVGAFIKQLRD
jgi:hypothetical protein